MNELINKLKYIAWTLSVRFRTTGYRQMKLSITRVDWTDKGIFGHLTCDGDSFNCVTLENHSLYIPPGTYTITLYDSPEWKYKVPLLHLVPNRSFIEIHCGNWETNSKGCILVGSSRDESCINSSHDAFNALMKVLVKCDDITVTIK